MPSITLLGPQRLKPTVPAVIRQLNLTGPLCAITAGWREREGEVDELQGHLDQELQDLMLYGRAERIFERRPQVRARHRERQRLLKELQRGYRVRLFYQLSALRHLQKERGDSQVLESLKVDALEAVRRLDEDHCRRIGDVHLEFAGAVAQDSDRQEVLHLISESQAVLIAGGHVAVLLNRLRFFGLLPLLKEKTIIAWSAGAMTLTDRIVVFHDCPPQGAGDPEVLERGLGLVSDIVALPGASERLMLDDEERVSRMALRFHPDSCLTFDPESRLSIIDGRTAESERVRRLSTDGGLEKIKDALASDGCG